MYHAGLADKMLVLQITTVIKMKRTVIYFFFIALLGMSVSCQPTRHADLIVYHANIYTVDSAFSKATAFAVNNGRFVAVGSDNDILSRFKSGQLIDAGGKPVYPGFNDGHSHFLGYGIWKLLYCNLVSTTSMKDVVNKLKDYNDSHHPDWLLGKGWDQNDWKNTDFPTNKLLNKVFPDKPVVLTRIDGHAVLANSVALEIAGINAQTKFDGGEVVLKNGKPTGVLVDNAADSMKSFIPAFTRQQKTDALLRAQNDCFAVGLTTVSDAGLDKADILLMDSLQQQNILKMRVYAMINPNRENFDFFYNQKPWHKERLTVSSVKLYIDGALGSRGALLLKDYSDDPGNTGLRLHPPAYYDSMCKMAYDAGFQVNTHAIGDSGNRIMLHTYAKFLKGKNNRRWRIEHAQVIAPDDFNYFGKYSIIPSVQTTHCTSDMYWADERLGQKRLKTAYAYHDLMLQNGWLVNGTDFPIEDISPLKTFYAAVARKDLKGWPKNGFQTENALSREEALRSITIWPAKGSFDENQKGSIETGKAADFVILDEDLMTAKKNRLYKIKVLSTWVNGQKVFTANP